MNHVASFQRFLRHSMKTFIPCFLRRYRHYSVNKSCHIVLQCTANFEWETWKNIKRKFIWVLKGRILFLHLRKVNLDFAWQFLLAIHPLAKASRRLKISDLKMKDLTQQQVPKKPCFDLNSNLKSMKEMTDNTPFLSVSFTFLSLFFENPSIDLRWSLRYFCNTKFNISP